VIFNFSEFFSDAWLISTEPVLDPLLAPSLNHQQEKQSEKWPII
jgi:hypothetical protein